MYLAIVVMIILLILVGEIKKFAKLFVLVPAAILVVFAVTSIGGLEITGRIGPVNMTFFKDHLRSITGAEDTPGSDPQSRVIMSNEALEHFRANPIFGYGFGQPLTSTIDMTNGAVTRMPHNSTVSYLARLGLVGLFGWIAFHFCLLQRFIYALRQRKKCKDELVSGMVLWLFLFYVLLMISSMVEPAFEFPSIAVPFYFFLGFAVGLIRMNFPDLKSRQNSSPGFVTLQRA
jgi:O-antigen ligase